MRLRFSSSARSHIDAIYNFLNERNPAAARRIVADIQGASRLLIDFPHMGRKGDEPGTREWVVRGSPYLIVYEVDAEGDEVWVLAVFHGAQQREP